MAPIGSSTPRIKGLLLGESTSGKTGALMSLAAVGYKLRILDLDNKTDLLRDYALNPNSPYVKRNPSVAANISVKTCVDPMKFEGGRIIPASVTAWQTFTGMLMNWKDGGEDFGPVTRWGPDCVLVVDTLSSLAKWAYNFHLLMNQAIGKDRTQNEARRDIGATQSHIRKFLDSLMSEGIKCHILVLTHITSVTEFGDNPGGLSPDDKKSTAINGFPSAIGRALGPEISRGMNNVWIIRPSGLGTGATRRIYTNIQQQNGAIISAMTSAPLRAKESYDIQWGLAELFQDIRGVGPNG